MSAFAKDHILNAVTILAGLIAAAIGDIFCWWIDPVRAIIIVGYTISIWIGTVAKIAVSLVGQAAPSKVLQKVQHIIRQHHPLIKLIGIVCSNAFSILYFVEVEIELPIDMPLNEAYAVRESLQRKIEQLPEIERAFVN